MLTPFARRVISRTRCLNRSRAFGAMTRLTSGPAVKLNPRKLPLLRSRHRTLRLIYLELDVLCLSSSPPPPPPPPPRRPRENKKLPQPKKATRPPPPPPPPCSCRL